MALPMTATELCKSLCIYLYLLSFQCLSHLQSWSLKCNKLNSCCLVLKTMNVILIGVYYFILTREFIFIQKVWLVTVAHLASVGRRVHASWVYDIRLKFTLHFKGSSYVVDFCIIWWIWWAKQLYKNQNIFILIIISFLIKTVIQLNILIPGYQQFFSYFLYSSKWREQWFHLCKSFWWLWEDKIFGMISSTKYMYLYYIFYREFITFLLIF